MFVARKVKPTQRRMIIIKAIIGAKNQVRPIFNFRLTIFYDFALDLLVNLNKMIRYTIKIVMNENTRLNGPSVIDGKIKLISTTLK